MCSQINATLHNPRVAVLSNTVRHPIIALCKATCGLVHRFKSRRHKSKVVALSNQASTHHSNFTVSSEKTAVTADVHLDRQAVGACLTLDNKPQRLSNAPEILGSEGAGDVDMPKFKPIDCNLLALVILSPERPPSNVLLASNPKLCDTGNGHFTACAPSSAAPQQRGRSTSSRGKGKKGEQSQRKKKGGDGKKNPNEGGNDGGKKRTWCRHPVVKDKRKLFDCPFHKYDAVRYHTCRAFSRFCDLKKHIERQHLLAEDTYHCTSCRDEFSQISDRDEHMRKEPSCQPLTIVDTGMMLEDEYSPVRNGLHAMAASGSTNEEKWNFLWNAIFETDPPSHYIQDTATIENAELSSIRYPSNRNTQTSVAQFTGTPSLHNYNNDALGTGNAQVFGNHSFGNQAYHGQPLDTQSSNPQYLQSYDAGLSGSGYPHAFETQSLHTQPLMQPTGRQPFSTQPSGTQYLPSLSVELTGSGSYQGFTAQPSFDTQPSVTRFSSTRSLGTYDAEPLGNVNSHAFDAQSPGGYHPQLLGVPNLSYRTNQFTDPQPVYNHSAQFSDGDSLYSLSNVDTRSLSERRASALEDSDAWTETHETPEPQYRNRHWRGP
ncbi:hypothetical protein CEP52_013203 [Fusarium oligoseptatum]|uniref:C2H2-type domain-containing protein n=1 Tax=Fusarium oligoseptatum TaxID=2604345 RepID=A0A428SUT6_9HYPO|nr:hypothetical protein CEP52_013203 [Fusarium oligoseptatum]